MYNLKFEVQFGLILGKIIKKVGFLVNKNPQNNSDDFLALKKDFENQNLALFKAIFLRL